MHLVLGASGGIGHASTTALLARGETVRVLVRDPKRFTSGWPDAQNIEVVAGDAMVAADVLRAAQGARTIFHCVNVPYPEWSAKVGRMLESTTSAAMATGARVIFPGNVYVFGHARTPYVAEDHPMDPCSRKGALRLQMERRLAELRVADGLDYTIVRMPDFYGPFVLNQLYAETFRNALNGRPMPWYGDLDVPSEFLYVSDGGVAMVNAGLDPRSSGETYHVPGPSVTTPRAFLQMVANEAGTSSPPRRIPPWMVSLGGIGNPLAREFREMMYLKQERFILDGSKYRSHFGSIPSSPYEDGVRETLSWFRANPQGPTAPRTSSPADGRDK